MSETSIQTSSSRGARVETYSSSTVANVGFYRHFYSVKEASISMQNGQWNMIGTMSGTSLDGLDICTVCFSRKSGVWSFEIQQAETITYSPEWKTKLAGAHLLNKSDLHSLDEELSVYIGSKINEHANRISDLRIDAVGSHGHTVLHDPSKGITLQIGNRPILRVKAGVPTICNFRIEDVAMGGEGAPLVPIGDELLFSSYDVCLNLGGFSNLSTATLGKRRAWDVAPVNIGINQYANVLGLEFDRDGEIARSHAPNTEILKKLNALPYYAEKPPKSLGREWLETNILPLTDTLSPEVAISTLTHHGAVQISRTLNEISGSGVLLTGGGTRNKYLVELIQSQTRAQLHIPDNQLIDFKEALIFAFLGLLKMLDEVNILSSVTGAPEDHSAGIIYP